MFRKHRLRKFKFLIPFSAMILSFSFPALCNWQGNGLDQDNTLGSGSVRWHTEGYTASKVDVGFEHMNPGWAELFKYILEAQGAGQPLDATKLESLAGACEENDIYQQQDNGGNRYYRHPGQPEKSSFRVNASVKRRFSIRTGDGLKSPEIRMAATLLQTRDARTPAVTTLCRCLA